MNILKAEFKRKFSISMYKNLKLSLAEMTFAKDFVNDKRGDMYPLLAKDESCQEIVAHNRYTVRGGDSKRFFCQFFPYATYETTVADLAGKIGFEFCLPTYKAFVGVTEKELVYRCGETQEKVPLPTYLKKEITLIVSCRPSAFDVYFQCNGRAEFFHTFDCEEFSSSDYLSAFSDAYVALCVCDCTVKEVLSYLDNGISIADIRPIRYENGEVMIEQGKIYLTASIRMRWEKFQGVFSWVPGTTQFALTGALFYDASDGKWGGDVGASIRYNRVSKQWYLWVCMFSSGHILAHSVFEGDPRFGINVIDVTLMERAMQTTDISEFAAFEGDEDPDFFYDEALKKWRMSICRLDPEIRKYRYVFFESDNPFDGYKCIGKGNVGVETGGSFVKIDGETFFLCGNSYHTRSEYRIYHKGGMTNAKFNYPDGGFRGWGTLIPVKMGSRTRYFWLTFDRHNASDYTWSYGNLYCFEAYDL